MDIKNKLRELGLNPDNSVVIGSGILNALNIRESEDIDIVVSIDKYESLGRDSRFKKKENHGREVLADDIFEIGTSWTVLDKDWKFDDFLDYSDVIDGVRYNTLQFLLDVKRRWIADGDIRQKDIDDVKLMENYLREMQK